MTQGPNTFSKKSFSVGLHSPSFAILPEKVPIPSSSLKGLLHEKASCEAFVAMKKGLVNRATNLPQDIRFKDTPQKYSFQCANRSLMNNSEKYFANTDVTPYLTKYAGRNDVFIAKKDRQPEFIAREIGPLQDKGDDFNARAERMAAQQDEKASVP